MKYTIDRKEKYSTMKLEEANLNSTVAPDVKSTFIMLNSQGVRNLIFDMSDVDYMDSSGLSTLLTGNRIFSNTPGSFVVTNIKSDNVKKLFEISRLNAVLNIIPTAEESVDFIFMEELERDLRSDEGASSDAPAE